MPASDEGPAYTRVFARVFQAELQYVERRRDGMDLDAKSVAVEHSRLGRILDAFKDENLNKSSQDEEAPQSDIRPSVEAGLVGLALSGGGIRSATFNLGLLQALARKGVLRYCDYLSTVSGGGYIGSCLSSLLDNPEASVKQDRFPFRFQRDENPDERKEVKHLRRHSSYLCGADV